MSWICYLVVSNSDVDFAHFHTSLILCFRSVKRLVWVQYWFAWDSGAGTPEEPWLQLISLSGEVCFDSDIGDHPHYVI